jgi:hypothetical protein
MEMETMDKISIKLQDEALFRDGFVAGWMECIRSKERDKRKLKELAETAADNFIKDHRS